MTIAGTRKVYKYEWPLPQDRATFDMPHAAEILSVQPQYDGFCIWARVVTGRHMEPREFILCCTGADAPDPHHRHVGTVVLRGGALVLHIFEVPNG